MASLLTKSTTTEQKYLENENQIPIIYIEGGIGCGKSTLVSKIQDHCKKHELKILTIQEPVDIWMTIKDKTSNKNMIEAFYSDQEKYSFHFQMMAYISRLQRLQDNMDIAVKDKYDLVICERSLQTDKNVFCKMLYDEGKIDEYGYQIYTMWFEYFQKYLNNSKFVYLKTDYNTCYERILMRARNGESVIEKAYLEQNNQYHDDWLCKMRPSDVLILDGNQDANKDKNLHDVFIEQIFQKFVQKK